MSFTSIYESNGYGRNSYSEWENRFPDHSGTENPRNNPERTQRIQYLENQIYNLQQEQKQCDYKHTQAQKKVTNLQYKLEDARSKGSEARAKSHEWSNELGRREGRQLANKERLTEIDSLLRYTNDEWSRRELIRERGQRTDARWELANKVSEATDKYRDWTAKMHKWESKTTEYEWDLSDAQYAVTDAVEVCRLKKQKLEEFQGELSSLNGGW